MDDGEKMVHEIVQKYTANIQGDTRRKRKRRQKYLNRYTNLFLDYSCHETVECYASDIYFLKRMKTPEFQEQGLNLLDLGCGTGKRCLGWEQSKVNVIGMDMNEDYPHIARQKAKNEGYNCQRRRHMRAIFKFIL